MLVVTNGKVSLLIAYFSFTVLEQSYLIVVITCRLFAQLTFTGAERAEFHVMQYIKLPVSDRMPKSISKNVKRDSILPLDLLRGTDNDVKCYLANCLRVQQVKLLIFATFTFKITVHSRVMNIIFVIVFIQLVKYYDKLK